MRILNNSLLIAFQTTADKGSVSAAAADLSLTQTAVTKRLQTLETELSLTLFIRSRRGMTLTEDGAALLRYCRSVQEIEGRFLSQISGSTRNENSLTIVGPTSVISTRVVTDCTSVYKAYPHLRLHMKSEDSADGIELLRRGEADFAVTLSEAIPNEMEGKRLKPDQFLLLACPKWKSRRLHDILENERIIDFNHADRVTTEYLKAFKLLGRVKKSRLFVNENEALIHLFIHGVGFGVLTESVAKPYVESGQLVVLNKGQTWAQPLTLAWYPRPQPPDYFSAVIKAIK